MSALRRTLPALLAAAAITTALVAACTPAPPAPTQLSGWRELPAPAPGARVLTMLRDGPALLAFGSVPGPDGRAPAAWTTPDGRSWHSVPLHGSSPYAAQAELIHAALADGRITALGQAFGGAHSNPRLTIWSGSVTGLVEYPQPVELFGGPHAIAVNGLAARTGSAVLAGQWDAATGRSGAAAWTSLDGADWTRDADDPALTSAPAEQTSALAATATPAGYLITGDTVRGTRLQPLAWTSPDARSWHRLTVPDATGPGALAGSTVDNAACANASCALFGATVYSPSTVQCWSLTGDTVAQPTSGPLAPNAHVTEIVARDDRLTMAIRTAGSVVLADVAPDCTGWRALPAPVSSRDAAVGDLPSGLVLATTGPTDSHLWLRPG